MILLSYEGLPGHLSEDPGRREWDRDRYCEARMGGRVIRDRLVRYGRCSPQSARNWTRWRRQNRVADTYGQPPAPGVPARCQKTWSWDNGDGRDSESCGDPSVAYDTETEEPRCAAHLAERDDGLRRRLAYVR